MRLAGQAQPTIMIGEVSDAQKKRASFVLARCGGFGGCFFCFWIYCVSGGGAKEDPVGLLVGLTGWFSVPGNIELTECKTAAEMVNDRGGMTIKGEKYLIDLVPEDMKSTNEGTTAAVNKLIYDDKVQFIVGPSAFWGPASAPLCEANKMINVLGYCANTPGELDKNTPHRVLAEDGSMGHATR